MTTFIDEIKQLGELTEEDRALLAEMRSAIEEQAPEIVERFYAHLQTFPHLDAILNA
ncbi:MAG TPA: globin-coupled sensor protein, partial [Chloroflexi bacterium]|nr:globin-coupled sensor protein [Chloroflexota bacterium]